MKFQLGTPKGDHEEASMTNSIFCLIASVLLAAPYYRFVLNVDAYLRTIGQLKQRIGLAKSFRPRTKTYQYCRVSRGVGIIYSTEDPFPCTKVLDLVRAPFSIRRALANRS
jgi:hypothetical protein